MTIKAFDLAEKYQMLCMIITDKYLGESVMTTVPFDHKNYKPDRGQLISRAEAEKMEDGKYKRFEFTETGVSKRAVPGTPNCVYAVSTDEHNETGDLDEALKIEIKWLKKRDRKLQTLKKESLKEIDMLELHGVADAPLTIEVGVQQRTNFGSTRFSLEEQGKKSISYK